MVHARPGASGIALLFVSLVIGIRIRQCPPVQHMEVPRKRLHRFRGWRVRRRDLSLMPRADHVDDLRTGSTSRLAILFNRSGLIVARLSPQRAEIHRDLLSRITRAMFGEAFGAGLVIPLLSGKVLKPRTTSAGGISPTGNNTDRCVGGGLTTFFWTLAASAMT